MIPSDDSTNPGALTMYRHTRTKFCPPVRPSRFRAPPKPDYVAVVFQVITGALLIGMPFLVALSMSPAR